MTFFEFGVVVYIITYVFTDSVLFEPVRSHRWLDRHEKLREVVSCHFCFSFYVSFAIVAIFGYMPLSTGSFFLNVLFNGFLLVFAANLLYVSMEILRNVQKLAESVDYWVYGKGKEK